MFRWRSLTRQRGTRETGSDVAFAVMQLGPAQDPYPIYDQIRSRGPLVASDSSPLYVTVDHSTASAILRDSRLLKSAATRRSKARARSPLRDSMLSVNPPQHTRLRRLASHAFSPAIIDALEPTVDKLANQLLDALTGETTFDLVRDFAAPLPRLVIGRILGIPAADLERLATAGQVVGAALDGPLSTVTDEEIEHSSAVLRSYFLELFDQHRASRRDNLLQHLIDAQTVDDKLSHDELMSMCCLLLFAGYETTVNLIGNGTLLLIRNPDALAELRRDPSLLTAAIEEMLRLEAPIQLTNRVAAEPTRVHDTVVPAEANLLVILAGANRDPSVFTEPHRLILDRPNAGEHLSFSSGIHFCLGARLARLEAKTAFRVLLERFPRLALAGPAPFRETAVLRSLQQLPVRPEMPVGRKPVP